MKLRTFGIGLLIPCLFMTCRPYRSEKPEIALIMKSLANEFFKTMENGAREHHQEHSEEYELLVNGIKDERDLAKQIELVEEMIARQADAIVIAPADSKALIPVCRKAIDSGIVVVNIDNKLDEGVLASLQLRIPFVGPDNRKGAKLVGDYLAKNLKPGDEVAIIEGVQGAFNAVQRKKGFEDAMNAAGMKVAASHSADWHMDKANQVVSSLLPSHPGLKAILCANDSMALGAVAALEEGGKSGEVFVVGFDNISAVQQLIQEKKILATADQHADKLAIFGIKYALSILENKNLPQDQETPVDLITLETVAIRK